MNSLFRRFFFDEFQEEHGVDEIADGYSDLVIEESHVFSSNGIETRLKLAVDITDDNTYKYEYVMKDGSFCRSRASVKFKGNNKIYLSKVISLNKM